MGTIAWNSYAESVQEGHQLLSETKVTLMIFQENEDCEGDGISMLGVKTLK